MTSSEEVYDGSLTTEPKEDSCVVVWVIYQPRISPLKSQNFSTGLNKEFVWYLTLSHAYSYLDGTQCNLELFLLESSKTKVEVEVEVFISGLSPTICSDWGFQKCAQKGKSILLMSVSMNDLRRVCERTHGALKIRCRIIKKVFEHSLNEMQGTKLSMSKDFQLMVNNDILSDVELVVEKQKFRAHKIILASRSPVFMAMFQNDMQEKLTNIIDIPDISPDGVLQLLNYIYSDGVENLEESAEELLAAAEKYQILGLKSLCSKAIMNKVNEENAIEFLILADIYKANDLIEHLLNFIVEHMKNLLKGEEIDALISSHPSCLKEILARMVNSRA